MAYIAVLTALQPRADLPAHPRASLEAGGLMLLERNVRLLRNAGAQTIYILTDDQFAVLAPLVDQLGKSQDIKLISSPLDLTNNLADDDSVMVLDEGVLLDERLIDAVAANETPYCIAAFPSGAAEHERAVRIDPEYSFASLLKAPGIAVRDVCRGLGDWDFVHTLLRAVAAYPTVYMLGVPDIDTYVVDRRRALPVLWQPMKTQGDQSTALDQLIEAAQPHVLDWPARFLHPPVENALLRLLLAKSIRPTLVLLLMMVMGVLAVGCFAAGWPWPALLLVLGYAPLEGMMEKLARLQVRARRRFLPLFGLALEIGCYTAIAWNFYYNVNESNAWIISFIICLCRITTISQYLFYLGFTGRALDDAGPFERRTRLFAACRNTVFWAYLPFVAFQSGWLGYQFIAAYAAVTFFLAQLRFFLQLKSYGATASPVVAANFRRFGYGSLHRRKSDSS